MRCGAPGSHLVSEALRPAESTELWQQFLESDELAPDGRASFANALAGMRVVVAPTAHDEAEAIALILKSCIETPGKTAALVTPDRVLARRVAARLKRYDLVDRQFGGRARRAHRARRLSRSRARRGRDELRAARAHGLAQAPACAGSDGARRRSGPRRGRWSVAPFATSMSAKDLPARRAALRGRAHRRQAPPPVNHRARAGDGAEAGRRPRGCLRAARGHYSPIRSPSKPRASPRPMPRPRKPWRATRPARRPVYGRAMPGEALSVLLGRADRRRLRPRHGRRRLPAFLSQPARRRGGAPRLRPLHPRLFIWGPLEARLQQPDVVILGSLNEGVWPRPQEASPWLSRPDGETLGLPPPERRIGLAAHDFAQALGARHGLSHPRAQSRRRADRALALAAAALGAGRSRGSHGQARAGAALRRLGAGARQGAGLRAGRSRPSPCPPVEARPRKLSVTRIERWIANPYEIFAKDILRLEPLKPLGAEPDRGLARPDRAPDLARVCARPSRRACPTTSDAELIAIADEQFAALGGSPRVEAFWRPHFQRFARWFAATEPARRADAATHPAPRSRARSTLPSPRLPPHGARRPHRCRARTAAS